MLTSASSGCQSTLPIAPFIPPSSPLAGLRIASNLTLLIFADSVHRIGLASFCHEAKGRLERSGFAGFAKSDVKGMPLLCRIRSSIRGACGGSRPAASLLRMIHVSSYGVPPDEPYHYKALGSQASTWYYAHHEDATRSGANGTTLLERGTVRRFAKVMSLLDAADMAPDVVLVASALWDMARMEELGRGPGAWVPWVHVRGQSWPRSARVEAWFRGNASDENAEMKARAFVDAWQANASALLEAVREEASQRKPRALVIWQGNPTLPDFYSGAVSRFMSALNRAAERQISGAAPLQSPAAASGSGGRQHSPSMQPCRFAFYDVEALMLAGHAQRWWGPGTGYATCCQDGYGHLRPRVMSALYLNLLRGITRMQGEADGSGSDGKAACGP